MSKQWTLSWGVCRTNNELSKEQGVDSHHDTLDECKLEVKRLTLHYKKLKRVLWFANAKDTNGRTEFNLHRQ
jgi:hypothetical protein